MSGARDNFDASAHVQIDGVEVPAIYSDPASESATLREKVGVSFLPHYAVVRIAGDSAYEFIDRVVPSTIRVRDGQIRQALLLNEAGLPLADIYLGAEEDDYLIISEGCRREALLEHLQTHARAFEGIDLSLSPDLVCVSLNGPFAWELMTHLEGPEVVGFPYLTFYRPTPDRLYLRAGKTGEFGYDLFVPREDAQELFSNILDVGQPLDAKPVGIDALWLASLENTFFNIHREGRAGLTPVELQLQWRISLDKDFVGATALKKRRGSSAARRLTLFETTNQVNKTEPVVYDENVIGSVLRCEWSFALERFIGLAALELPFAHSGVDAYAVKRDDSRFGISTVSAPFVDDLSMFVNPQRHAYATRSEITFPGHSRS